MPFQHFIKTRAWNIYMLAQVLPSDIVQKILCMAVPHRNSPDVMIWTASTSSGFSLSSTFQELRDVKTSSFMLK